MRRILVVLLVSLLTVVPVAAYDDWPWCADQDIFFWNNSSDITGYRTMDHVPEKADRVAIVSPSFSSSTGEVIIGTWVTPSGSPGTTTLGPGLWRFRTYAFASSSTGVNTIQFYIINRSSDGTETDLFYGNAITTDIERGTTPTEYLTSYVRRNYTTFFTGDRLVIRANASTTVASARTLTMEVAGNTNASMVSVSYFVCDESSSGACAYQIPQTPLPLAIPIVAVFLILLIKSRKR